VQPVLSTEEMRAVDAAAAAEVPTEVLVARAGSALAREVLHRLGGAYGRRVVVVAGKGHNGDDGRYAASRLARRGAKVTVLDPPAGGERRVLPACDAVVDAAYGTGFRGEYVAPQAPPGALVVAADIPSGVHGDTGAACAGAVRAHATVTFAAWKPGLLLGAGPELAGEVRVADIGLDVSRARTHLLEDRDVAELLQPRPRDAHKWRAAVAVAAGSPGMLGAARLCAEAGLRAGAGMVRLFVPGLRRDELPVTEAVAFAPGKAFAEAVLAEAPRCKAVVIGPGLGASETTADEVRAVVAKSPVPVVVDADGLGALGTAEALRALVASRPAATVALTPHAGEFRRLAGMDPLPDPLGAARGLAGATRCVVVLKGPTTVVADPDGSAYLVAAGSPRLATAGTGDVLAGIIGAFVARAPELGLARAAALASHVHGRAAALGPAEGLVASDLLGLVPKALSRLVAARS
jgi:hydroxyethylthiazole kinase-like uncharacterized protein yjeF